MLHFFGCVNALVDVLLHTFVTVELFLDEASAASVILDLASCSEEAGSTCSVAMRTRNCPV
jgi:hypothetical protein